MATTFPGSKDSFDNPTNNTLVEDIHPNLHTDMNDAMEAVQTKVGIDGSGDTDSLDYKITNLGLQEAFDVGQSITIANNDNQTFSITNNDTTNNQKAFYVVSTTTSGDNVRIEGVNTSGNIFVVDGNSVQTSGAVVRFVQGNASATAPVIRSDNGGTGNNVFIDQNGDGISLNIDSEALSASVINTDAVNTSGTPYFFGASGANTAFANFRIRQTNGSATAKSLAVGNSGTGDCVWLDQNGDGIAFEIDSEATTKQSIFIEALYAGIGSDNGATIQVNGRGAGPALKLNRIGTVGSAEHVFTINQQDSTSTGGVVSFINSGTGACLTLDQNGNDIALEIDSEATTLPSVSIDQTIGDGSTSFELKHGGTTVFSIIRNDNVTANIVKREGNSYFWTDTNGDYRIHTSNPTTDTDGVIIGTQS